MSKHFKHLMTTIAIFAAPASYADVTPVEVWEQMQVYMASMGQTLNTKNLEQTGDLLIAHDVSIDLLKSGGPVTAKGSVPKVVLKQLVDGKVEITTPDPATYAVSVASDLDLETAPISIVSTLTMDNVIVASGVADKLTYEVLPGTVTYVTPMQVQDDVPIVPEQIMTALGVQGTATHITTGDVLSSAWEMNADTLSVVTNGTTELVTLESRHRAEPVKLRGDFTSSITQTAENPQEYLKTLNGTASYSLGNIVLDMASSTDGLAATVKGATGQVNVGLTLLDGVASYEGSSEDTEIVMTNSAMPFPQIDFGMGRADFGMTLPLLPSDDAQPMGLQLALENLRVPAAAWAMIDPQNQMEHAPATFKLDLSGHIKTDVGLMDTQALLGVPDASSAFEPIDMKVNELFLSFAGATLTGAGDLVFKKNALSRPPLRSIRQGNATVELLGGMSLIDTLSQAGTLPPQMRMSAKMMLGAFARPGETPDSYIADIEMKNGNSLTVNGRPMPF